jgi:rod shape-determining protein MreC
MAPPSDRRPGGFSRRRQYGLFAAYVAAVLGILIGIMLILAQRFDPQGFTLLRGAMLDLTSPATAGGRVVYRGGATMVGGVSGYFAAVSENRRLRHEVAISRPALVRARALEGENRRLRALLRLREPATSRVAVARLVGSTAVAPLRYATLAAGYGDGVRAGQPVRGPDGLIGRVTDVGQIAARVLLLTDEGNVVPVRLARDGLPALATGTGNGAMELKALIAGNSDFRRGDLVVTSGTGGLYPPNIPVAVVTRIVADGAIARPIADPNRLDFAIVERPFLPPPPSPPATAARP